MGLFDKKYCDFCGNKIGLLGNKKLEDVPANSHHGFPSAVTARRQTSRSSLNTVSRISLR